MKRNKLTNPKLIIKKITQNAQATNQQPNLKKSGHKDIEAMWTTIQKKEKELTKKHSPHSKKQREIITDFLRNHQINPQTGYVESKWNKKSHYVSCGSKVIK